jgi:hypothetical protein
MMIIRHRLRRAFLLVALVTIMAAACGGGTRLPPGVSPEGRIAISARQLLAVADVALTGVDAMIQTGRLPQQEGVRVIEVLRAIGITAQQLASALAVWDAARDETAALSSQARVTALLSMLQTQVLSTTLPVGTESNRQEIARLIGSVNGLVLEIAAVTATR